MEEDEASEVGFTGQLIDREVMDLEPGMGPGVSEDVHLRGDFRTAWPAAAQPRASADDESSLARGAIAGWHEICFRKEPMQKQTVESARGNLVLRAETLLRQRWNNLQEARKIDAPNWKDLSADLKVSAARGQISRDVEAAALGRIRRSLDRIELGTYGKCLVCGGEMETERLRAIPDVERCGGCTH